MISEICGATKNKHLFIMTIISSTNCSLEVIVGRYLEVETNGSNSAELLIVLLQICTSEENGIAFSLLVLCSPLLFWGYIKGLTFDMLERHNTVCMFYHQLWFKTCRPVIKVVRALACHDLGTESRMRHGC